MSASLFILIFSLSYLFGVLNCIIITMNVQELIQMLEKLPENMEIIHMAYEQPQDITQILTGILVDGEDTQEFLSNTDGYDPEDFGLDKWPKEKVALID